MSSDDKKEERDIKKIFAECKFSIVSSINVTIPTGYSPLQIRKGYGLNNITYTGTGQKIAVITAFNNPKIVSDFKFFDSYFGIGKPNNLTVKSYGVQGDQGWGLESSLDTQAMHAIAPDANILLVQAASNSISDLLIAVNYATSQGYPIISMSWGANEFGVETFYDRYFNSTGVIFVASSGDTGGINIWPSVSPYITSVGGTTLNLDTSGNRISETGWSGSGGGVSRYEPVPSFQYTFGFTGKRRTPDVSADADPNTGLSVYDSYGYGTTTGWFQVGGTSLSAPLFAAVLAITNQIRVANSKLPLTRTTLMNYLYNTIGKTTKYSSDINDITSGQAGSNVAKPGFDLVTGFGTPKNTSNMSGLISDLSKA